MDAWALAQTVQAFIFVKEYRKLKKRKYDVQNGQEKYGGKKTRVRAHLGQNFKNSSSNFSLKLLWKVI